MDRERNILETERLDEDGEMIKDLYIEQRMMSDRDRYTMKGIFIGMEIQARMAEKEAEKV